MKEALIQRFHKAAYYLLQSMRGRHVGPFVRRLKAWDKLDAQAFSELTQRLLLDALRYARAQVPLYSSGAWQQAFSRANPDDLSSWPVLERKMLITHREQLLARRRTPG